jgi:hypothetical protein
MVWRELGNPIYNINRYVLQCLWVFTWRVSDCEELVGVFTEDGEVGLVKKYNIRVHRLYVRALRAREAKIVPILCH